MPLRGTVKPLMFLTVLAGHRSSLHDCVPRFSDAPSRAYFARQSVPSATPGHYRFFSPEGKKIVGGEESIAMGDPTGKLEQVDGYEVPVDPMDDLECDSCQ